MSFFDLVITEYCNWSKNMYASTNQRKCSTLFYPMAEANSHQGRLGFTSCIQNSDWLTGPIVALLFVIYFGVGSISSEPLILSHFSTDVLFVGRRCHTSKADKHGAGHCSRAPVHYRYENCSQVPFLTATLGHVRMG